MVKSVLSFIPNISCRIKHISDNIIRNVKIRIHACISFNYESI